MVMEAPSPQCVGREFVRQYYTLLNKAPMYLHRFYSNNSSFLHGGMDRVNQETKPVIGQLDIHQKIMQLNFKDCHAKIKQVDSHETLGDGVVVQVTGELSNNGQPMRRFMQTFVLAPQSPKKYYVRNDIFRYQDEIITDDDETENDNALTDVATEEISQKIIQVNENTNYYEPDIVRNGSVHTSETVNKFVSSQQSGDAVENSQPEEVESSWDEEVEEEDPEELEEATNITIERTTENNVVPETETMPIVSKEPKTYANMVSKNTSGLVGTLQGSGSATTSPVAPQTPVVKPEVSPMLHKSEVATLNTAGQTPNVPQIGGPTFGSHRPPRPNMNFVRPVPRNDMRDNAAKSPEDFDGEKRKPVPHYSDSQQLFVGNLNHTITEEELKSHFNQFGTVLDIRINTKQNQKVGGGKVPFFGFVVFENPECVQKVLKHRPIFFNDHRLNVEEKKKPTDKRLSQGDNRIGRGLPARVNASGRGGGRNSGGLLVAQGTGRGENRGGMKNAGGVGYMPRH